MTLNTQPPDMCIHMIYTPEPNSILISSCLTKGMCDAQGLHNLEHPSGRWLIDPESNKINLFLMEAEDGQDEERWEGQWVKCFM